MSPFLPWRVPYLFVAGAFLLVGFNATTPATGQRPSAPIVTTNAAQNGAMIVTLTANTSGVKIHYTLDGSKPSSASTVYEAPFLVTSSVKVKAIAIAQGLSPSKVTSRALSLNIPPGTLVWSDEFNNATDANSQPNPTVWTYDTRASGRSNNELENYCGWKSSVSPCNPADPNSYVGTDGYLHVVALQPSAGVYTSARLRTQGLFSLQYGRFEVRARVPEGQGLWPAVWLMGNSISIVRWPACGEMDVLERVNAARVPDWNEGSIHGAGFTGSHMGTVYHFSDGQTAGGWHTYGMIWKKGSVSYYIDDPSSPYVTYTPSNLKGLSGAVWPFDSGASYILINLAVGGNWPGNPNDSTAFPAEMLVDYVRVYTN